MLFFVPKLLFIVLSLLFIPLSIVVKKRKFYNLIRYILVVISFFSLIYLVVGNVWGRFHITVSYVQLHINNLPEAFNHYRIVQLSDIHIGSFLKNESFLNKVIETSNKFNPNILVITGDLVNQYSSEIEGKDFFLKKLCAKEGKFFVLGNHDFGDYAIWKHPDDKEKNLKSIVGYLENANFKVLRNESVYLRNNNDSIAIIGVDNWGLKPFKQYGDIEKASKNINKEDFCIILSHDPTYWSEKIADLFSNSLTLSGHTHAFQFGIDSKYIKWSPVKWRYKNWWGLYKKFNNYLYVSRGIGTIGFLGRMGMYPEVVCIELIANE